MAGKHYLFDENRSKQEALSKSEIENEISGIENEINERVISLENEINESVISLENEINESVSGLENRINQKLNGAVFVKSYTATGIFDSDRKNISFSNLPQFDSDQLIKIRIYENNVGYIDFYVACRSGNVIDLLSVQQKPMTIEWKKNTSVINRISAFESSYTGKVTFYFYANA